MKKKTVLFHQDIAPSYKSMATIAKLHELHLELLPHPTYSPDPAPTDYWLFSDLKKLLPGERFGSNKQVVSETDAYFGELKVKWRWVSSS